MHTENCLKNLTETNDIKIVGIHEKIEIYVAEIGCEYVVWGGMAQESIKLSTSFL
jgi:hypothetical protein